MLIILIWLGSVLPDKYFNTIKKCEEYPQNQCVLLGEAHWFHYINKYRSMLNVSDDRINKMIMVERTDVLRLLYIYEKGGVYSDMDNVIDYPCLYDLISKQNQSFFSQEQKNPIVPSNNFIYAPTPKDPKIKRVIELIQECPACVQLNFASPYFLDRITVDFVNINSCVDHQYDYTWANWDTKNINPIVAAHAQCTKDLQACVDSNQETKIIELAILATACLILVFLIKISMNKRLPQRQIDTFEAENIKTSPSLESSHDP